MSGNLRTEDVGNAGALESNSLGATNGMAATSRMDQLEYVTKVTKKND